MVQVGKNSSFRMQGIFKDEIRAECGMATDS